MLERIFDWVMFGVFPAYLAFIGWLFYEATR